MSLGVSDVAAWTQIVEEIVEWIERCPADSYPEDSRLWKMWALQAPSPAALLLLERAATNGEEAGRELAEAAAAVDVIEAAATRFHERILQLEEALAQAVLLEFDPSKTDAQNAELQRRASVVRALLVSVAAGKQDS